MADGVISDTMQEAKAHPYWIVGGFVGLVVLLWMLSGSSKAPAPQQFSFSYGPSDAQLKAGNDLAIAQSANQTAVSLSSTAANYAYQTAVANNDAAVRQTAAVTAASIANTAQLSNAQLAAVRAGAAVTSQQQGYAYQLGSQTNTLSAQTAQLQSAYNASVQGAALSGGSGSGSGSSAAAQVNSVGAAGFVASLYKSILGRTPDLAGEDLWTNALTSGAMTPAEVTAGITNSVEHMTALSNPASTEPGIQPGQAATTVTSLYSTILGRQADAAGLAYWGNRLTSGQENIAQVSSDFMNSKEYLQKVGLG